LFQNWALKAPSLLSFPTNPAASHQTVDIELSDNTDLSLKRCSLGDIASQQLLTRHTVAVIMTALSLLHW
jgi:hypothetical protein